MALPAPPTNSVMQVSASHSMEHYARLQGWLETIQGHDLFHHIVLDEPLQIHQGGSQEPFHTDACKAALSGAAGVYTCGINLFWCNPLWAPAMDVPIRDCAMQNLMDRHFQHPANMPHAMCIALEDGETPLAVRGSWRLLTPEEVLHAMVGAIARDISRQAGPEVLAAWKRLALSTTAQLRVFSGPDARLHRAMQLRENLAQDDDAMSRSTVQRIYEIASLRRLQTERREDASVARIAELYKDLKNSITRSFVDTAFTLYSRVLSIPAAERLLLRMDNKPKAENPFNSVHKLQVILNRAHRDQDLLLWLLHAIAHMVERLNIPAGHTDLSMGGLTGKTEHGHRGTLDLLAFKRDAQLYIFSKLALRLGLDRDDSGAWLLKAKINYQSHESFYASHGGAAMHWRRGMTQAQSSFLRLAGEIIYGTKYDTRLRAMVRNNRTANEMAEGYGFKEELAEVQSLHAGATITPTQDQLQVQGSRMEIADDGSRGDLILDAPARADGNQRPAEPCSRHPVRLPWGKLTPEIRSEYERIEGSLKRQLDECVHLLTTTETADALAALLQTPAGTYAAGMHTLVGIICDARVLGEASHRPAVRLPPMDYVAVLELLTAISQRHTDAGRLHPDDLYLTLHGGRRLSTLNPWFHKQDTTEDDVTTRSVTVHLKHDSVAHRYSRVRGVCSLRTCDVLKLTAQPWPAGRLRTRRWLHYEGTTQADSLGPVVMPNLEDPRQAWLAPWGLKKKIYGPHIIRVGGRMGTSTMARTIGSWRTAGLTAAQALRRSQGGGTGGPMRRWSPCSSTRCRWCSLRSSSMPTPSAL